MIDIAYFNRLLNAGVLPIVALDVLWGKTLETEALADAQRRRSAANILALAVKDGHAVPGGALSTILSK